MELHARTAAKQKDWYKKLSESKRDPPAQTQVPVGGLFGYKYNTPDSSMDQSSNDSNSVRHEPATSLPLTDSATELLSSISFLGDVPPSLKLLRIPLTPEVSSPEESGSEELPAYFLPLPSHLSAVDIDYLRNKGAFEIPPLDLRNEIVRCYVEYMHPYMPLMDVDKLLCLIDPHRDPTTIPRFSLLLYQTVLLAGIACVDEALVKRFGHPNIKAARKLIYERARLLYDIDFECNVLTLIQSLILMSFWSANLDARKQGWHWIGNAVSFAQGFGLGLCPDNLPLSPREKSLRKRLWWCCFARDRLISIGLSRPTRIRHEDFDVPLLEVEDFENSYRCSSSANGNCRCSPFMRTSLCDKLTRVRLAESFISSIKLCTIIGSILSSQYFSHAREYEMQNKNGESPAAVTLRPISHRFPGQDLKELTHSIFTMLDQDLIEWYKDLPSYAHCCTLHNDQQSQQGQAAWKSLLHDQGQSRCCDRSCSQPASVTIQVAVLHLGYHASVSALHRPRNEAPASKTRIAESARQSARVCSALNARGLAKYLPVNVIPMLVPSLVWHSLFIKSFLRGASTGQARKTEGSEMKEARDNLSELFVCLTVLRSIYVGGSFFSQFVSAFLRRAGLILVCRRDASQKTALENCPRIFELELDPDHSNHSSGNGPDMVPDSITPITNDNDNQHDLAVFDVSPPSQAYLSRSPTLPIMDSCSNSQLFGHTTLEEHVAEDGATWHSMLNFTAFEGSQLVESWDTNTFVSPVTNGSIDAPPWENLGQNWGNCLPSHEGEDTVITF
ncbi:hypothetical protein B0A52_04615 [Exophiala mesophila]|uniref:Xylanolytic transcriptional activator regulatory domain-containing protein n=1 Tax=Exophiala mesophila TaxID=212818 RepID=A0A438N8C4_EXOME|nr:hypothetical protein B0A52_04615 [Exophiala mesophila]